MEENTSTTQTQSNLPELANRFSDGYKMNIAKFDEAQRERMNQIVAATGPLDNSAVDGFGVEPQQRASRFLDQLLQGYKTYEAGQAGEITMDLARHIKDMNLPKMKREVEGHDLFSSTIGKIPFVGKYASALYHFKLAHDEILKFLGEIEDKAQREFGKLAATNAKLDQLTESTLENLKDLEIYLAAGQSVLLRARADFSKKRDEIIKETDPIALTKLRDEAEQINAFETRLLKMHIAFTDALVSIPQIRLTQEAARIEGRNIMDTILFDLPRLKSAILRVSALKQISDATKADEARREITRQIGAIGAEALDEAYTKAKESQGSGAEDVAALAATADKLLETIAKGVRIDEENRTKRDAAQKQLEQVKDKLMDGLRANAIDMATRAI